MSQQVYECYALEAVVMTLNTVTYTHSLIIEARAYRTPKFDQRISIMLLFGSKPSS